MNKREIEEIIDDLGNSQRKLRWGAIKELETYIFGTFNEHRSIVNYFKEHKNKIYLLVKLAYEKKEKIRKIAIDILEILVFRLRWFEDYLHLLRMLEEVIQIFYNCLNKEKSLSCLYQGLEKESWSYSSTEAIQEVVSLFLKYNLYDKFYFNRLKYIDDLEKYTVCKYSKICNLLFDYANIEERFHFKSFLILLLIILDDKRAIEVLDGMNKEELDDAAIKRINTMLNLIDWIDVLRKNQDAKLIDYKDFSFYHSDWFDEWQEEEFPYNKL